MHFAAPSLSKKKNLPQILMYINDENGFSFLQVKKPSLMSSQKSLSRIFQSDFCCHFLANLSTLCMRSVM